MTLLWAIFAFVLGVLTAEGIRWWFERKTRREIEEMRRRRREARARETEEFWKERER